MKYGVSLPGLLLIAAFALAGCKSGLLPKSSYLSPRVTGRVLDAKTGEPLAKVSVRRVVARQQASGNMAPKGGELMERRPPVRTDTEGQFVLPSERGLTLLSQGGWYSVTVSIERSGYVRYQTDFTVADIGTNVVEGEPVVNAGDILLNPLPK